MKSTNRSEIFEWGGRVAPRPKAQTPRPYTSSFPLFKKVLNPSEVTGSLVKIINSKPAFINPKIDNRSGTQGPKAGYSNPSSKYIFFRAGMHS